MSEVLAAYFRVHPELIGVILFSALAGEVMLWWILWMLVRKEYLKAYMLFRDWKRGADASH